MKADSFQGSPLFLAQWFILQHDETRQIGPLESPVLDRLPTSQEVPSPKRRNDLPVGLEIQVQNGCYWGNLG